MQALVSHGTGWDPVTRFRDFETISALKKAFSGGAPSRGVASRGGDEVAKPLCLLAETNKARCWWATGLVWPRDESRGLVEWRLSAGPITEAKSSITCFHSEVCTGASGKWPRRCTTVAPAQHRRRGSLTPVQPAGGKIESRGKDLEDCATKRLPCWHGTRTTTKEPSSHDRRTQPGSQTPNPPGPR